MLGASSRRPAGGRLRALPGGSPPVTRSIALGAWSNDLARSLGLSLPFFVKRGYHMHYEATGGGGLNRPVLDLEKGYVLTPMAQGLRLTTGAEFARLDDPPSAAHLDRLEPFAREMFSARGPQGGKTLARPPPLPARHAPDRRAFPGQAGPLARFRPPPPRPDAGADQRAASGGNDERRTDGGRPGAVPGGAVRVGRHANCATRVGCYTGFP